LNIKYLLVTITLLFFTACGSNNSSSATAKTVTGEFIDEKVQGLKYTCSSGEAGTTNINGEYTCNVGDNVSFYLNNILMGASVSAQTLPITPYSIFPNDNAAALNFARLLQSLNTNSNTNVIEINTSLENKILSDINFSSASFDTDVETSLGITLVSPSIAQIAMNTAILSVGASIPSDINNIPIADSGADLIVAISSTVSLNGLASSDADSNALSYLWEIKTKPNASVATLSDTSSFQPSFTADIDGIYIIELIVNDGYTNSSIDSIKVTASTTAIVPVLEDANISVAENAIAGTPIGNLNITSSGSSMITAITLSGTGNENFEVSVLGAVSVKVGAVFDSNTTATYNLTAIATSSSGNSSSVNLVISVIATSVSVSVVPTLANSTASVSEDASTGDVVGNMTISSSGNSVITSITLSGTGNENFEVSTSGVITVKAGASLDYETNQSYTLTAIATNSAGNSNSVTVSISVSNIVEVLALANSTASVLEDASTGGVVGNITISNSGNSAITSITLSGTGNENFEVSIAGVISVKAGASLNYNTTKTYNLSAIAVNAEGSSNSVTVTISVVNVLGNVAVLSASTGAISEGAATGSSVGSISITSVGDSNITAITLSGTGSGNFEVSSAGAITVKSGASLDYETTQTYNLTALATNAEGNSASVSVTISVLNIVEVASLVKSSGSVDENATTGNLVGTITITSAGDSNITVITLSGTGNGNFDVSTAGVVSVKAGASLDYETTKDYNLTAIATNLAGNSSSVGFNISILDILDTATFFIKSAVYDNNATSSVADDKLYIYFDQTIKSSSIDTNMSANYTLAGTGFIGSASASDYNDTIFHQHIISLDSASTALLINDTNISIATGILRDTFGNPSIYDANTTQAQKFRVLLKTELTISYPNNSSSDRDDGYYEKGKTRSYTDNANNTITDNVTGLIWQKEDDNTTKTWADASTYCSGLTLGGSSSWRVPNIEELSSLSDYNRTNPSINSIFTSTESYHYWSSTVFVSNTANAFTVIFDESVLSFIPKTSTVSIRCVRTGL